MFIQRHGERTELMSYFA